MSRITRDGAAVRRERIRELLDIVEKNPEASENRIKGLIMLRTGLTFRTIGYYIEDLILSEILRRENDKLSVTT